jgi:hypothetical protein
MSLDAKTAMAWRELFKLTIKRFTNPGATKDCASHREPMSAAIKR